MKASINTYPFRFILSLFVYLGTSWRIRGDHGTENVKVAGIQRFFRHAAVDAFSGEKSFQFGKSTSNQVRKIFKDSFFLLLVL